MRTATAPELALLASVDYQVSTQVLVEAADGALVDLCDLDGEDRVEEIEGSVSVDDLAATCTVRVARDVYERSLSPLRSDSPLNLAGADGYAPLLALSRELQVRVATHASGTVPAPADWKTVFAGRVHDFDLAAGDNLVAVTAADAARRLLRARVEVEEEYGSAEGTPVQTVIRQILDRWGFTDLPLEVPVDPEWSVRPYKLGKGFVLEAVRTLAQGRGWDVRVRWSATAGAYRLTLYQLDPEPTAPVHTFGPDDILAVRRLKVDDADMRNAARVEYRDRATGKRREVWETDATSIEDHDRLSMEFIEGDESPIDTEAEARALGRAAVHALGSPNAEQEIDVRLFWPVELGDYLGFAANRWYNAPQLGAVSAIRWRITRSERITTLTTRGKPVVAHREYLRRSTGGAGVTEEYRILQARIVEDLEDAAVVEVLTTPAVEELAVFTQAVRTPYVGGTDPKQTGEARGGVPVDSGRARLTLEKAAGGFLLLASFVPLDSELLPRGLSRELAIPAAVVRIGLGVRAIPRKGEPAADVEVYLDNPSASAFPVEVELFLHDEDESAFWRHTFTATGTRSVDSAADPRLRGLALPDRRPLPVIARAEAVDGTVEIARTAPNRDPLPWGVVTADDYRPDARLAIEYDPDTDLGRVRRGGVVIKTFGALIGGGAWVYIRGSTVLDDGSVEDALGVGEESAEYVVELEGGGETREYFRGRLHGTAPQAPAAEGDYTLTAARDAANLTAVLTSPVGEELGLRFRESLDPDATVYTLVASDDVPLYVPSGTRINSSALFDNGPGGPIAKFAAVPLRSGQLVRRWIQAYGRDSGVSGPWTEVVIALQERPVLASITASYNPATGHLAVELVGGTHQLSVYLEASDDPLFPLGSTLSQALAIGEGAVLTPAFAIPAPRRRGTWYVRGRPYNGALVGGAPSGLPGEPRSDKVEIAEGAPYEVKVDKSSNLTTAVVRLYLRAGAAQVASVAAYVYRSNAAPPASATAGTLAGDGTHYFWMLPLDDPKAGWYWQGQITRADGTTLTAGMLLIDKGNIPSIGTPALAYASGVATIRVPAQDSDVAQVYVQRLVSGTWTAVGTPGAPDAGTRTYTTTLSQTAAAQPCRAYGVNAAGVAGPPVYFDVEAVTSASAPFVTSIRAAATAGNTQCGSLADTIYLAVSDTAAPGYGLIVEEWRPDAADWQAVHGGHLLLSTTSLTYQIQGYRISTSPTVQSRREWVYRARVVRTADGVTASPPQQSAGVPRLVEVCP